MSVWVYGLEQCGHLNDSCVTVATQLLILLPVLFRNLEKRTGKIRYYCFFRERLVIFACVCFFPFWFKGLDVGIDCISSWPLPLLL